MTTLKQAISEKLLAGYQHIPALALRNWLRQALAGTHVALCLHRVDYGEDNGTPPTDTIISLAALDELLDYLSSLRQSPDQTWLSVCFDDAYADAARYIEERHSRFRGVEWLLFVCPEKLERRAGFRWDLPKGSENAGAFQPPFAVRGENLRPDLQALGDSAHCRLASLEQCRRIQALPSAHLGNHTNCHFQQTLLPLADCEYDLKASQQDFERLFGKTEHFAFPFGLPVHQFGPEHAEIARSLGYTKIWSTEPRPFSPDETQVLPRFPVYGSWPVSKNLYFMALCASLWRARKFKKLLLSPLK